MKKIIFLILLSFFISSNLFAQKDRSYELANHYLKEKGEVVIRFKANNKQQFQQIGRLLSLGHKHVEESELEGEAYANSFKQFQDFLTIGVAYEVTKEDNEIPQEYTQRAPGNSTQAVNAWDTTWDAYPRYSEYVAKMQFWATTYPSLCKLEVIGTTPLGRTLYALKISDNPLQDETEPEFFYTSSMHGDEITGYPTMLHLIDYLLTNYGSLSEVTNLVNGTEIYINPLANPDGSYKTAANDIFNPGGATNTPTRANSAGSDLNRNYPDAIGGLHDDGLVYQPETIAFMNYTASRNFVLAANYHGGTEVVNYPLDTSNTPGTGAFSYHPHDLYLKYISEEYAGLCQVADGNLNYMDAVYNTGQMPGVTNGAAWYSVYGGRQDASNYFDHNKEITVEISDLKTPAASSLPFFWDRNRQALLNYMKQANYGLHGVVTDQSGNPIHAKVYVAGTADNFGAWVETSPTKGDYHKVQIAGSYNVIFEAPGYTSQTHTVTLTNGATTTLNITMVPTTSIPTANDVTICQGQTANLSASGTGTIRWYDTVNTTTALASTTSYTTPALTTTRSYWVEREIALANVGPAVSGTGVNNTTLRNRYLIFNCSTPTKLKSVSISNSAVGDIMVELQNSSGVMLESKVVRLTTTGVKDIELDFFLPAATGLRLVSRQLSTSTNLLTRANSGITYPITSGNISITGNSGTGIFYQFFTWKLAPVKSNRDEVVVTVKPNPTNASISPTTRTAGSGAFTVTVNGTNFENSDIVRWNGANRTTTFVSATQLTAAITGSDVATAGTANVTVFRTCNTSTSSAQTLTITGGCVATAPVPNVSSLPNVTGQCSATVVTVPTATSNCYGQITATTTSPLTYNTQGTFTIVWNYNDGNGNTSTQNQTVIVDDTIAPVANITNLGTVTGQCAATVSAPTATDNCGATITGTTPQTVFNTQGTFNIVWTYNDGNGNTATQNQTVIVDDTIAPVANVTTLPTLTGQCTATVTAPTANDVCAGTITGTTPQTVFNTQGTFNIVWTYNDGNGNTTTQNQTVIVDDTIAPVPNVTTLANATGQCSRTVTAPTATDNCGATITGTTTQTVFNTQGTFNIVWTYNDGNGNTSTQNQTVIVDDTIAPVANVTTLPNATGQCARTVTAPTATDNCGGTITGTTPQTVFDTQGTFNIVWTYNDGNGNTSTQNQTVIVDDTIAPVANVTTLPTVTGQCSRTVTAPTANDACAGTITGTTPTTVFNTQGTFNIVWTYNDGNGNTSTQNQTVIVDDTVAPVPNVTTLANVTGSCSATVTVPTATDICAGQITATTPSPLTYNTQGNFNIVWTYNDGNGNTSTQNQTVIINDTNAPIPNVTNLDTVTGQCSATVIPPTASDNCLGTITATTASPLTYNTQGAFNITWTYTDANGNTATQNQVVVVSDTAGPVPNLSTLPTITGQCSVTVTGPPPTATDACSGQVTATTSSALTYNTLGTHIINWIYTDSKGNATLQTQTVIVNDTTAPVPNVTSLPTVTGQCSVTLTAPTATDNCAGTITATSQNQYNNLTQGNYTITWTYDDGSGNITTQTQTVIVNDTTAPVANLASLPNVTGQCFASLTFPTATDNCSGNVTATTTSPLTYDTQGTYNVVWTYTDARGNTSTQNQTVIVNDTTGPVPQVTSLPTITRQCSAVINRPTASDNCSGLIFGQTTSPLTYNNQGTYPIIWTYTDAMGNTTTQNQTIIVDDTIAPVPTVTTLADVTGQCSATVTAPTATDNCVGQITATTTSPLNYNTQGTFNIVWTYNDGNGNIATQNQTVIVNDNTAPVPNVGFLPEIQAYCGAVATPPTATDNCSGTITGVTTSPLVYPNQGIYEITWTYTDAVGNTSSQTQSVYVNDIIAPTANVASLPDVTGECTVTVSPPTATDNCTGQITAITTSPTTYNTQGTYNILWLYNDGNGNTTTQNQTVIVTNGGPIVTYYQDLDGDGFGNINVSTTNCVQPVGYVTNHTDCNDAVYSLTNTCGSTVNLKLFIEGYYNVSDGLMTTVQTNQNVGNSSVEVDMITVELRDTTTYNIVESLNVMLYTNGNAVCNYPNSTVGSYYVVVKGTNSLQTWSANPITVGSTPVSYDFTTAANKAYGDNMIELTTGVYGFFSGDVNQDEVIDASDAVSLFNDVENSAFGALNTDLNGDGSVDNTDIPFLLNNSENSIYCIRP